MHKEVSFWLDRLYREQWEIGDVLNAFFSYVAAGQGWQARYRNTKEVVEFAQFYSKLENCSFDKTAVEFPFFISQMRILVDNLSAIAEETQNHTDHQNALSVRSVLQIVEDDPSKVKFYDIYNLILSNWSNLKGWTITYRILANLAEMQWSWLKTDETLVELTTKILDASKVWD